MTVAELIDRLTAFPGDAIVTIYSEETAEPAPQIEELTHDFTYWTNDMTLKTIEKGSLHVQL